MNRILIYGATGYMGKLAAKEFVKAGIRPILAARSAKVEQIARELDCDTRIFSLTSAADIAAQLDDVTLFINLAGPFTRTQKPIIEACLQTETHYIDIAGEVDEMRSAYMFDAEAKEAGIMLMPGAGFGIVPTDLAAKLAVEQLPDATTLTILYATEGGASRGTLKTVLGMINQAGVKRIDGQLVTAQPAESKRSFSVAGKQFTAVYNPWRADLFTAGLSTSVRNISTYSVFPGFIVPMMKGRMLWLRNLLLKRLLRFLPEGPTVKQLQQGATYVKAIGSNGETDAAVGMKGPEAYLFTALCLHAIAKQIQMGNTKAGFQTPAFFGRTLLNDIASVVWE